MELSCEVKIKSCGATPSEIDRYRVTPHETCVNERSCLHSSYNEEPARLRHVSHFGLGRYLALMDYYTLELFQSTLLLSHLISSVERLPFKSTSDSMNCAEVESVFAGYLRTWIVLSKAPVRLRELPIEAEKFIQSCADRLRFNGVDEYWVAVFMKEVSLAVEAGNATSALNSFELAFPKECGTSEFRRLFDIVVSVVAYRYGSHVVLSGME